MSGQCAARQEQFVCSVITALKCDVIIYPRSDDVETSLPESLACVTGVFDLPSSGAQLSGSMPSFKAIQVGESCALVMTTSMLASSDC